MSCVFRISPSCKGAAGAGFASRGGRCWAIKASEVKRPCVVDDRTERREGVLASMCRVDLKSLPSMCAVLCDVDCFSSTTRGPLWLRQTSAPRTDAPSMSRAALGWTVYISEFDLHYFSLCPVCVPAPYRLPRCLFTGTFQWIERARPARAPGYQNCHLNCHPRDCHKECCAARAHSCTYRKLSFAQNIIDFNNNNNRGKYCNASGPLGINLPWHRARFAQNIIDFTQV